MDMILSVCVIILTIFVCFAVIYLILTLVCIKKLATSLTLFSEDLRSRVDKVTISLETFTKMLKNFGFLSTNFGAALMKIIGLIFGTYNVYRTFKKKKKK